MSKSPLPTRRRAGVLAVLVATLVALGASLLVPAVASAQDAESAPAETARRPRLTDEQRQCLRDQGLERPARGERPTDAQRQAFRDAAEACGIELPDHPGRQAHRFLRRHTTAEQRQCLRDADLERPARGERPTDEQRHAFRDAAEACGIDLPDRPTS